MKPKYIDFHCHPDMKPYGKTWSQTPNGQNTTDTKSEFSIWHRKSPNILSRAVQLAAGIAKFTQSDFHSLMEGGCKIICTSLYSVEKEFFSNNLGGGTLSNIVDNFITCVGKKRVDYIQSINNYFEDLQKEYHYYEMLNDTTVTIDNKEYKYYLLNSYADYTNYLTAHPNSDNVLFVIMSIEGLHTLNSNLLVPIEQVDIIANLRLVKAWKFAPFFITVCHHFNNHLCGHAESLFPPISGGLNQIPGRNEPLNDLGIKVIEEMLDKTHGKRIYPDIKHMSIKGRIAYYQLLQDKLKNANDHIPIIVSHGAANGRKSSTEPNVIQIQVTGSTFMENDINFYDDEIVLLAKSEGLFCIMFDEHRLANKPAISNLPHFELTLHKLRMHRSILVWNQIQHVGELLDKAGLNSWDCIAIGSDSDGIINPINGFLTEETLPDLYEYLVDHANKYMNSRGKTELKQQNQISGEVLISKFFTDNGTAFLKKWFV